MLSKEIDIFEIQLDNPTAVYIPGDTISGKLILVLNSPKSLRALKLRFRGECKVSWSESRGSGSDSETDHYGGTENYVSNDTCLVGAVDGATIRMQSGHYVYPFSFNLPHNIPSSYKHIVGNICYSIEGIFDRAWRIDDRVKRIITVEAPLEWEPLEPNGEGGIDQEIVKSFCCCILPCINLGGILVRIHVPNTHFECNDRIEATINIKNKSNIGVTKIIFKLEEVLNFHSTSPTKTKSVISTIQEVNDLGPFSKNTQVKLGLKVPKLPFSFFKYCKLIDMNYRVNISVHYSGCHCATRKTYNIVIGSRSPMPTSYQQLSATSTANYPTPSEGLQVPIYKHCSETDSSPPVPVGYIDSPYPPSLFAGPFPPECDESPDTRSFHQNRPSDQDN